MRFSLGTLILAMLLGGPVVAVLSWNSSIVTAAMMIAIWVLFAFLAD